MSLKVYKAYKLPKEHSLFDFIRYVRPKAFEGIKEVVYRFMSAKLVDKAIDVDKSGFLWDGIWDVWKILTIEYRNVSAKGLRDLFDFDVSLTIREYNGDHYIIPYCDMLASRVLDFIKDYPGIQEYYYFNNVDKPKEISNKEWKERARVWEHLTEMDVWPNYLVLEVMSHGQFYTLHPISKEDTKMIRLLIEEIKQKKNDRPS